MAADPVSSRRGFAALLARLGAASMLPARAFAQAGSSELIERTVPASGEHLPAVGLGTAGVFDVGADEATRARLGQVLQTLVTGGGRVVDTASSYGNAESVLGDLLASAGLRSKIFVATKLESPNAPELKRSLERLRTDKVDLLQLHNVRNDNQTLAQFRDWKSQGICRYSGITSTYHGDFAAIESVMRRERPDFVQFDYSLDNRVAEQRLLPLAAETGCAVLTALPLGRGRLFRAVRGKALPEWAKEFDAQSWGQFFLKFLLGDPRVTCVIPGTSDPAHVADNLGAARGRLPDAALRKRMVQLLQNL